MLLVSGIFVMIEFDFMKVLVSVLRASL